MEAWKLFYDGTCNLCHASQLRVVHWAKRSGQPLQVEILQGAEAKSKGYAEDIVLELEGRVLRGGDAWLTLIRLAPAPLRWLAGLSRFGATRWIVSRVYRFVARVRHRLFGRRACALKDTSAS